MAGVDDLSPDQRAVLALLLTQGRRYDELAALLRIDGGAVRRRAAAALDALGGGVDVPAARRARLTDWLLGQASGAEADATRDELRESAAARAWARTVAAQLRPLGGDRVPEVPGEPEVPGAPEPPAAPAAEAPLPGFDPRGEGLGGAPRSSRLGGALLLAGIAVVVAVALVILLTRGNDNGGPATTSTVAQTRSTTSTGSSTTAPRIEGQVNLTAPGGGTALGVASVIAQGNHRAVAIQAQKLTPNTKRDAYAVWLAAGQSGATARLGFAPAVGRDGRLQGVASLPADASSYRRLEITLETRTDPRRPGRVVLRGAFGG